jgi:hypothetical protein
LLARSTEPQAIRDIVQAAFQQPQQGIARDPGLSFCAFEDAAELTFLKSIDSTQLLFFAQL